MPKPYWCETYARTDVATVKVEVDPDIQNVQDRENIFAFFKFRDIWRSEAITISLYAERKPTKPRFAK